MAANPAPAPAKGPLEVFQGQLTMYLPELARVLPPSIPPERFAQVCMNAVLGNSDLLEAVTTHTSARKTFFAEALKCATDGLVPDGREATFTTFTVKEIGKVVKYMPMIQGILKKVRNSGELVDISAHVVYEKDDFEVILGDDERIMHKPPKIGTARGKPVAVYAIAKTTKEGVYREVMDESQVQAVAACARTKTVWQGAFADEMRRKTVLRRLSKRLPMSSDVAGVFARDDDLYDFTSAPAAAGEAGVDAPAAKPGGQASKTRSAMGLERPQGDAKAPIPGESRREPEAGQQAAGEGGPPPGHPAGESPPGDDSAII